MTERLELLVGDKIELIKKLHVLILGLGGVGGYALESIVRCGISEVTIIDSDIIDITNKNRQIIATDNTIGMYKVDAWKERILSINPNIKINIIKEYITPNNIDTIFKSDIDYAIDCCDSIKTKEAMISYCVKNNIKLISSMGTGNKLDPSRLKITKLSKTNYDPIARRLRKYVKDNHIYKDIYVVCSDEKGVRQNIKTIPSNSFVPATAGLLCTSYIINDVIK